MLTQSEKTALLFIVTLMLLFPSFAFSQEYSAKGKLVDNNNQSVNFATVMLLSKDSSVAVSITDSTGIFHLHTSEPGNYKIRITAIGFAEYLTQDFDLNTKSQLKDLGTISLKSEAGNLDNITITALRPTIVQLPDRMVVSVEGTTMAAGNSAFTLLSKAPGIFIDAEGNIQLNGKAGITVMIDGRPTYLSARDLRNLLESMPAENIKNLEIITNPPAKYDAEGTAGILNINLRKNTQQGINGSIYSNYSYNFYGQHGASAGGNINFKFGKWTSFLNTDISRRVGGRNATFTRIFKSANTTYFNQSATGNFLVQGPPSFRTGSDYSFSDRHSIGFIAGYTTNTSKQDFLTDTYIGNDPENPAQYIDADNISSNTFSNFTGNFHYSGKPDTLGSLLSADFDYVRIKNEGEAFLNNYFTDLSTGTRVDDILYTNTPNGYNIYSLRFDFTKAISPTSKWEAGAKASSIVSDNDFRFYFNNGGKVIDPSRSNYFKYDEKIYAAYLNWSGPISKNFTLQTGLRAEKTESVGNSITAGIKTTREYLNFFPSVFLQQKVSDSYGINYSYTRRLTRPNYGSLNPFRAYRDPYTWYEGNTQLRPQYTNIFTISQVIKKQYSINLNYQHTTDVMSEIPILFVDDTLTVYTTGNLNTNKFASLSAVGPLKIMRKWDSQNTLYLYYNQFNTGSNNGQLQNDQLTVWFQTNHTILLPKDLRMEFTFMYRSAAAGGLYQMASVHRFDFAFKKSFFNKAIDLTVNVNDVFKGFRYYWKADINGNVNDFDQYFRLRSVGLSLRYNFSKGQKASVKQRTTIEELNRT